ncbi:hypothetical protein BDV95DRAFT_153841 [Massariosphaeria phaeospora]|uniref:Uncharacterized protein n=1 Tax=Massariosphaeria phaeospora TaxID=100035 RepID=A0A7C8MNF1_9PLEO|nr:hypothetical protein BDV95DRAFT_153841 [Massariosphaeria phaeospora]
MSSSALLRISPFRAAAWAACSWLARVRISTKRVYQYSVATCCSLSIPVLLQTEAYSFVLSRRSRSEPRESTARTYIDQLTSRRGLRGPSPTRIELETCLSAPLGFHDVS